MASSRKHKFSALSRFYTFWGASLPHARGKSPEYGCCGKSGGRTQGLWTSLSPAYGGPLVTTGSDRVKTTARKCIAPHWYRSGGCVTCSGASPDALRQSARRAPNARQRIAPRAEYRCRPAKYGNGFAPSATGSDRGCGSRTSDPVSLKSRAYIYGLAVFLTGATASPPASRRQTAAAFLDTSGPTKTFYHGSPFGMQHSIARSAASIPSLSARTTASHIVHARSRCDAISDLVQLADSVFNAAKICFAVRAERNVYHHLGKIYGPPQCQLHVIPVNLALSRQPLGARPARGWRQIDQLGQPRLAQLAMLLDSTEDTDTRDIKSGLFHGCCSFP